MIATPINHAAPNPASPHLAPPHLAPPLSAAPSAQQVRLLQAATLPGVLAIESWREWQITATLEALEPDSQWLLPLLYANLRQAGVDATALRRYANVYRHNWYKNQLLLRAFERVFIQDAEPPLLLGAAALALDYYPLLGARPIAAVTVLCPEPTRIAHNLEDAGWRPITEHPVDKWFYADALDRRVELWTTVIDNPRDADLLAGAQPLPFGRMSVRILSALDQLVMVLAQRDQWDSRSRLLWATDAALILRSRGGHIGPALLESAQGPPRLESAQVSNLEAVLTRARALDLEPAAAEGWRQLRDAYGLAQVMP